MKEPHLSSPLLEEIPEEGRDFPRATPLIVGTLYIESLLTMIVDISGEFGGLVDGSVKPGCGGRCWEPLLLSGEN